MGKRRGREEMGGATSPKHFFVAYNCPWKKQKYVVAVLILGQ